jgi:hypothetical protein
MRAAPPSSNERGSLPVTADLDLRPRLVVVVWIAGAAGQVDQGHRYLDPDERLADAAVDAASEGELRAYG